MAYQGGEASALAPNGWRVYAAPKAKHGKGLFHLMTGMAESCPPKANIFPNTIQE